MHTHALRTPTFPGPAYPFVRQLSCDSRTGLERLLYFRSHCHSTTVASNTTHSTRHSHTHTHTHHTHTHYHIHAQQPPRRTQHKPRTERMSNALVQHIDKDEAFSLAKEATQLLQGKSTSGTIVMHVEYRDDGTYRAFRSQANISDAKAQRLLSASRQVVVQAMSSLCDAADAAATECGKIITLQINSDAQPAFFVPQEFLVPLPLPSASASSASSSSAAAAAAAPAAAAPAAALASMNNSYQNKSYQRKLSDLWLRLLKYITSTEGQYRHHASKMNAISLAISYASTDLQGQCADICDAVALKQLRKYERKLCGPAAISKYQMFLSNVTHIHVTSGVAASAAATAAAHSVAASSSSSSAAAPTSTSTTRAAAADDSSEDETASAALNRMQAAPSNQYAFKKKTWT
jgi:hypothetical protein